MKQASAGVVNDLERARTLFAQGLERYARGELSAAESLFRQANELAPGRVSIMGNLSTVLIRQDRIAEAKAWAQQALALDADNFEACMNLGACLEKEDKAAEALGLFEKASHLKPDAAEAWSNRGHALSALKRHAEALVHYDRAVALQPGHAEAWTNRGNALNELGRHEEALASHDQALAAQPQLAEAWYNRGNALSNLKREEPALDSYDAALRIQPGHADAHFNKGLTLLNRCDFAAGWREYEWRWLSTHFPSRRLTTDIPAWDGRPFRGHLLAWAEQGVGDEVLYGSMLRDLRSRVGRLSVTMDPRLIPLFRRTLPDVGFVPRSDSLPSVAADRQIAMGSLGQFLRQGPQAFPAASDGFLTPDSDQVVRLRARIALQGKRVIGISWKSKNMRIGLFKTIRLASLIPVLTLPDAVFVDLQYGDTSAERRELAESCAVNLRHLDDIDSFNDIDGLSALIGACDAVVTTSNVTTHLAGALGKPTFQLTPWSRGKLWYWHDGRAQSLWYPSVKLYRQSPEGSWDEALLALAADLGGIGPRP